MSSRNVSSPLQYCVGLISAWRVHARRWIRDAEGATSTEYIAIVALVALAASSAFLALGVALHNNFETARSYVLYPVP